MKILITGIYGFTGSVLARTLQEFDPGIELWGIDNLLRAGTEQNRAPLKASGVHRGPSIQHIAREPMPVQTLDGRVEPVRGCVIDLRKRHHEVSGNFLQVTRRNCNSLTQRDGTGPLVCGSGLGI